MDTIVVVRSGFPFNGIEFLSSPDTTGAVSTRPDLVPGQPIWVAGNECVNPLTGAFGFVCPGGITLNAAAFADPPTVRQGNEPRNDIPGFGLTQVDLSLGRKFTITERLNLQFEPMHLTSSIIQTSRTRQDSLKPNFLEHLGCSHGRC